MAGAINYQLVHNRDGDSMIMLQYHNDKYLGFLSSAYYLLSHPFPAHLSPRTLEKARRKGKEESQVPAGDVTRRRGDWPDVTRARASPRCWLWW